MSHYVKETKRMPKDAKDFVKPEQAAKVLKALLDAVNTADPKTLWHFTVKLRVIKPEGD